jgi:60 kDa SS-A/Ro ribonucleoprotein
MKTNIKAKQEPIFTHENAKAVHINAELELRRSVMACLLWENEFYESGVSIAQRIADTIPLVAPEKVAAIAIEAREKMKLRHVPLLIVREMARYPKYKSLVAGTLNRVIQRADELTEFLSIYWKDGKQPLSNQVKKGLADAFKKFNEYTLAKYDRGETVKLRDVLFLCHAKPDNKEQEDLWIRLVNKQLVVPDTWEVSLSGGKNKKETFTRLIKEGKLGQLALLRNLRNCAESGVDESVVFDALNNMKTDKILPFRFISASRAVPQWEDKIEPVMMKCLADNQKLIGKTLMIVDVSGSMYGSRLSEKSELTRADVACSLAVLIRELCETSRIFATAGDDGKRIHATKEVPTRRGFALRDAIYGMCSPLGGGGIFLKQVIDYVKPIIPECDRIIVITDEQDCDTKNSPLSVVPYGKHNYLINVASNQNGIGYGKWTHIDGFSEAVIDYIIEFEKLSEK